MTESMFSGQAPLAARMRPRTLDEIVGQEHLLRPGSPLRQLASSASVGSVFAQSSVVLWGPPGTGKTTLAKVVAMQSGRKFIELSAVTSGVKDVRDAIDRARLDREAFGSTSILFLDEIHRFSKAQQDVLLPAVEAGWVVLIAATTENPSFSVISPLLSRSLLLTLNSLSHEDLKALVLRASTDQRGLRAEIEVGEEVANHIVMLSSGDARKALTILEASAQAASAGEATEPLKLTLEAVENAMDRALVRYDANGDQHYDVISAFIKSVRGSDVDAAIHYLARMVEAGEDPRFIARRLIILAAEDVGLADPTALSIATSAAEAVAKIGMPEGRIVLSEATIYLCLAPKSNSAYLAIDRAISDVRAGRSGVIPSSLRSTHLARTAQTSEIGVSYLYPHDDSRSVLEQRYLEGSLENSVYYVAKELGVEKELGDRWARLRAIIRAFKN